MLWSTMAWAQAAAPGPQPSMLEQFMPFIFIFVIFYFLLIRPQQKRAKKHAEFLKNIKRGDNVITASGIFGRVEGLTDKFATLEVAEDVRIRILKSQLASPVEEEAK